MKARAGGCLLAAALALPAQVKLPPFTREVLANGTVVVLAPRRDVPMITLRVLARGGVESDPAEMAGLSSMTAELLRRGTAKRTAEQFSEQLDVIGATFFAGADEQSVVVSAEFLSRYLDRALELTADAALRPVFPEAEVSKVRSQRIDGAKAVKDNPQAALANYFRSFFFTSKHPYGRPADEHSYARIERQHLVDCHRRLFTGRNLIVVAAGDFDPPALRQKLAAAFGAISAGSVYGWVKSAPPMERATPRLLLVDKPDATQTYFRIAQPGIHRTHPDRVGLLLVNTLFGGRFTSMLNDELRVNTGLTYGAGSQLQEDRMRGAIVISSYTRTDTTAQAIDLALEVLKRLREKRIDAEQLASTKTYIKGTFPTDHLETADQLADVLGEIELFDLDRGEVDDFFARIDAVTLEQANALARNYYRADNLQFALLGNAAKIRDAVARYAPVRKEIAITSAGLAAPEM